MSQASFLDLVSAKAAGEKGMLTAATHAEEVLPGWNERAFRLFMQYAAGNPDGFQTDEARAWAEAVGLEAPPDKRAWGGVTTRALKSGLIKAVGYRKQAAVTCHGSPKAVWAATDKPR